jgi:hypothetical protein
MDRFAPVIVSPVCPTARATFQLKRGNQLILDFPENQEGPSLPRGHLIFTAQPSQPGLQKVAASQVRFELPG